MIGTLLAGRYRLTSVLGTGGMAEVYEAWDEGLRRAVAVKLLHPELSAPEDARRFEREFHALATLNHPALLQVHDLGDAGGRLFLVSEVLRGQTLATLIETHGFPGPD